MTYDFSSFTRAELDQRYSEAESENEMDALEDEYSARHARVKENNPQYYLSQLELKRTNLKSYTGYWPDQDAEIIKHQGFYRHPVADGIHSDADEYLCAFCRCLDFSFFFANLVPPNELSIGYLKDIQQKTDCAFCRLVMTSVTLALQTSELPTTYGEHDIEVGLTTIYKSNDHERMAFDIRLVLHPMPMSSYPSIRIQRFTADGHDSCLEGRPVSPSRISMQLVKRWMTECERDTPSTAKDQEDDFVPSYLLDVVAKCVIAPESACRYLALSYVWGGPQTLQLLLENYDKLLTPNPGVVPIL